LGSSLQIEKKKRVSVFLHFELYYKGGRIFNFPNHKRTMGAANMLQTRQFGYHKIAIGSLSFTAITVH